MDLESISSALMERSQCLGCPLSTAPAMPLSTRTHACSPPLSPRHEAALQVRVTGFSVLTSALVLS